MSSVTRRIRRTAAIAVALAAGSAPLLAGTASAHTAHATHATHAGHGSTVASA
ncbi:YncE family protein, partial [Streptomyces sp. SID625]|nr:YncE family protein [Streptomyces sp. SID625]